MKEKILSFLKEEFHFKNFLKNKDFLNSVQKCIQNFIKIEKRFILFSKEIFLLEIIGKIIFQIQKRENDQTFFILGMDALKKIFEWGQDTFVEQLECTYYMITKLFKNNLTEFSLLMNKIIFNYYKIENNKRKRLIEDLLLKEKLGYRNEFLEYSYPLIQLIFNCSSLEPQFEQKSKFLEHFEDDYQIKNLINDKNEPKINENLLYRFEIVIDKYFQKIVKNGNDANQLCGNLSKNYLEKAINYF